MTLLESTFGNRQTQLTFVQIFILRFHTTQGTKLHTHAHTPSQCRHCANWAAWISRISRAINISLSASKCIIWSFVRACIHLPLHIWDLYLVLHQCKHCQAAFCPTFVVRYILRGSSLAWRVHSKDGWFFCSTFCVLCQVLVGDGQIRQAARLWLWQTQVSQMEWMCSQVAGLVCVCTVSFSRFELLVFVLSVLSGRHNIFQEIQMYHWSVSE